MPWRDPNDERNGSNYHTGKLCIERGCNEPAGTWWSPLWCFQHNVARMDGIDKQFQKVRTALDKAKPA